MLSAITRPFDKAFLVLYKHCLPINSGEEPKVVCGRSFGIRFFKNASAEGSSSKNSICMADHPLKDFTGWLIDSRKYYGMWSSVEKAHYILWSLESISHPVNILSKHADSLRNVNKTHQFS